MPNTAAVRPTTPNQTRTRATDSTSTRGACPHYRPFPDHRTVGPCRSAPPWRQRRQVALLAIDETHTHVVGLTRLIRVWLANRGIWEALAGAGPTVPIPAASPDVTRYVSAYSELLAQLR